MEKEINVNMSLINPRIKNRRLKDQQYTKKKALEVFCIPAEEQLAEDCSLIDYKFVKYTNDLLYFEFKFKNTTQVSMGEDLDTL